MARKVPLSHRFRSTRVDRGWWDPKDGTITVEFPDGVRWRYRRCTERHWLDFIDAGSAGRYLNDVLSKRPGGPA